jgi:hypothetical protein
LSAEEGVNMRVSVLSKTSLGWWSIGLCVASILLFALFEVILGPGPDYNMPLAYTLTVVLTGISIAAFVTGLLSIMKRKERAILVFVAMAIGLYSLVGGVVSLIGLSK